eukprot:CAMPEP_0174383094 /NCGR_PEP_ID=MMETSP0811_2-20130205/124998_1 /TAXON_ID=73025 ORGANISM="Eutreptiella gymnastica-like, Strain CCMP1594" /NCGR_SAMPLE_ID=MMETSP0811_2 /ASSEMBLY_ACC=CAM_ASM_000667 /LENGTH=172 /DNA_ID=CAMNT_0015536555 /DNA_START=419 /DNA_END=937 /DNA_ORIENTATION=-
MPYPCHAATQRACLRCNAAADHASNEMRGQIPLTQGRSGGQASRCNATAEDRSLLQCLQPAQCIPSDATGPSNDSPSHPKGRVGNAQPFFKEEGARPMPVPLWPRPTGAELVMGRMSEERGNGTGEGQGIEHAKGELTESRGQKGDMGGGFGFGCQSMLFVHTSGAGQWAYK